MLKVGDSVMDIIEAGVSTLSLVNNRSRYQGMTQEKLIDELIDRDKTIAELKNARAAQDLKDLGTEVIKPVQKLWKPVTNKVQDFQTFSAIHSVFCNPKNTLYVVLTDEECKQALATFEGLTLEPVRVATAEDIAAEFDYISSFRVVLQDLSSTLIDFLRSRRSQDFVTQVGNTLKRSYTQAVKDSLSSLITTFYNDINEFFVGYNRFVTERTQTGFYIVPTFELNGELDLLEHIKKQHRHKLMIVVFSKIVNCLRILASVAQLSEEVIIVFEGIVGPLLIEDRSTESVVSDL